eukprot:6114127-Pleurochrysis_carterae.AAC.1
MLQVGVQRDVPNFSEVRVQEEELCQRVVWMTIAAMMPFRLFLPKNDDFQLNLQVERREITKSNRSVAQRVLIAKVEADRHLTYDVWVRRSATVALRVAPRQRGTCFQAWHHIQNELTKQATQTDSERLRAQSVLSKFEKLSRSLLMQVCISSGP